MRLKLNLRTTSLKKRITPNYNYPLSAAIYKLLKFGSPEFSEFLHENGYVTNGKIYKLFTFSLRFEKIRFNNNAIELVSPNAFLYVSSPLVDDFIKNIVIGSLSSKTIEVYADYIKTEFSIEQAELIPEIDYYQSMKFKMLSPLALSTHKDFNGKLAQYYFRYDDDIAEINRVLNQNLFNKYKLINFKEYQGEPIELTWDAEYIKKQKLRNRRLSKKVSITKDINNIIDVIEIQAPFTLTGNSELITIGYECGFGEKNSMGFGMVEVVK